MFANRNCRIVFIMILLSSLVLAIEIQPVRPFGTVYRGADSSTSPMSAPIQPDYAIDSLPPPTEWNRTYGDDEDEERACSVMQTNDGGYVLAGNKVTSYPFSYWLAKTDVSGNMLWNKTYFVGGNDSSCNCAVQTNDGGFVLAGYTFQEYPREDIDLSLVKTDSSGNVEFERAYGGLDDDAAYAVVQTAGGGYLLVGRTWSFGFGPPNVYLIKTNTYGLILWNQTLGGLGGECAYSAVLTSDGGYVFAGYSSSFGDGRADFWLVKIDANGYMLWNKTHGRAGYDDVAYSVIQTSDGGYALVGTTYSPSEWRDYLIVKTDESGNMEWNMTFGSTYYEEAAESILQTSDAGFLVAGLQYSVYYNQYPNTWLVKIDEFGNMQWNNTYHKSSTGYFAYSMIHTMDDGYAIGGYLYDYPYGEIGIDFWLLKLGPLPVGVHDIAVTDTFPSKTAVGQGYDLKIDVTIANQGDFNAIFNVTSYANTTAIGTQTITLTSGNFTTITFAWNTTGFAEGNYSAWAYAEPVSGETDTTDNTFIYGTVTVTIPGDVDGDFNVDILDVVKITGIYASKLGDLNFNPNSDINNDGTITILDVVICTTHYGEEWP